MSINRRSFIKAVGVTAASGILGVPCIALGASKKVVVIGGGAGGATAARYLKRADPAINVTLIEANKHYYTGFFSNEVLGGHRSMDSIKFGYDGLAKLGINVVHDRVIGIDQHKRFVATQDDNHYSYDRCIISPGIDYRWEEIEGYNEKIAEEKIPHAWDAGAQTVLLRKQLEAMKDGGTVLITSPVNPFRCSPGPYERASQIAQYFKHHKPRSKVIILDTKPDFAKRNLYMQGWEKFYGYGTDNTLIEWLAGPTNRVEELRVNERVLVNEWGDKFKGDVINIIPPQKAGKLAQIAGLVKTSGRDAGWCPVDLKTFESSIHPGIHVIGDAAQAFSLPKSAYTATSQAKVCAAAVAAMLKGEEPGTPSYLNACYSIIAEDWGVSVASVYRLSEDGKSIDVVKNSGGVTPMDASPEQHKREAHYAQSWYVNITREMFG